MRVVSLVPSLTETLIEAGAEVVGRTRYCVHPEGARGLPVVGGTKDLDFDKLAALQPDLLVLDREENLPWMQERAPCKVHVFHATSVDGMAEETRKLANRFAGGARSNLLAMGERWRRVSSAPPATWNWDRVPAELRRSGPKRDWENGLYLIWKNPWMSVSRETFIGSVLAKLGAPDLRFEKPYPEIAWADFNPEKTLLLFSSEPFPFGKKWEALDELPYSRVLVDGESYSWFGIRTLRFLEERLGIDRT